MLSQVPVRATQSECRLNGAAENSSGSVIGSVGKPSFHNVPSVLSATTSFCDWLSATASQFVSFPSGMLWGMNPQFADGHLLSLEAPVCDDAKHSVFTYAQTKVAASRPRSSMWRLLTFVRQGKARAKADICVEPDRVRVADRAAGEIPHATIGFLKSQSAVIYAENACPIGVSPQTFGHNAPKPGQFFQLTRLVPRRQSVPFVFSRNAEEPRAATVFQSESCPNGII